MTPPVPAPDRRVVRTKQALRDALLALLAETSWDALSIQAMCDRANIGRSTFYLHYQGKDEVLSDSLAGLRDHLASQPRTGQTGGWGVLRGLLLHMVEQRAVFRAVIGKRGSQVIASRFKAMVRELLDMELSRRGLPADTRPWLASYLAGGMVEVMSWWVDAPQPPPLPALEHSLNQLAEAAIALALAPGEGLAT